MMKGIYVNGKDKSCVCRWEIIGRQDFEMAGLTEDI